MGPHEATSGPQNNPVAYVAGAVALFLGFVILIRWIRTTSVSGLLIGMAASPALAILAMIKLRCSFIGANYPCGFMAFTGGFTWHILIGLGAFFGLWGMGSLVGNAFRPRGWVHWMQFLGRAAAPLMGLWLAVLWEVMPVSVIHPPEHGGSCPLLPVICHDTPLFGLGGLDYWAGPFVVWACVLIVMDLRSFLATHPLAAARV